MRAERWAAESGRTVFILGITGSGAVWYKQFTEGLGNSWKGWIFTNGVLQDATIAASSGQGWIAGRDPSDKLWWFNTISAAKRLTRV